MRQFTIRLKRIGRWHKPVYEVVAVFADSRIKGGLVFEKLGFYAPATSVKFFFINFFRLASWLVKGATITPALGSLIGKSAPAQLTPRTLKTKRLA